MLFEEQDEYGWTPFGLQIFRPTTPIIYNRKMVNIRRFDKAGPAVDDEAALSDVTPEIEYQIASYGTDFDVDGIVKRVDKGTMIVPGFQRNYVWSIKDASSFIESLLLGLPVPGVFLAKENEDNRFLIIDGQQRIKTLFYFFNGVFKVDDPKAKDKKEFTLTGVAEEFEGKTYRSLTEAQRNRLNDAPIHATIIKQESPNDGDTSIYHIFDRLNSKGRKLTPQEIRAAVAHGTLIEAIEVMNENKSWRHIFGAENNRLKDRELILRFLALYSDLAEYSAPMSDFLNKFANKNRNANQDKIGSFYKNFTDSIEIVDKALGKKAFRLTSALNAAVFDSVLVSIANLSPGQQSNLEGIAEAYNSLIENVDYRASVSKATANETSLQNRFSLARVAFGKVDEK